jgi:hypothetical protein
VTTLAQPSTLRLSEVARHLVYPDGIVATEWPRIRRRLAEMSIEYDGWQAGATQLILGLDENGRYVATIGGVTMSLPRQVGKTFTIGSLLIAMCIEFPGLRVVWTSHHLRTTTNTFRAMQRMVRRKRVAKHLAADGGIRVANGEQEIKFANDSIIMFGARERGFGVGIDAIDVLVCDESQRLSSRALADMMPTTNQARHVHGALVFFIGTPPRPDNDGDEFAARRRKALAGTMTNGIYIEMSADKDANLDDPKQWGKANPSYPHRTPHEAMLRLVENLNDPGDRRREMLGIWDDDADLVSRVIMLDEWAATGVLEPPVDGVRSLGVKFSPDGSRVAVAGAMKHDGGIHVELVGAHSGSMSAGTASLVAWVAQRWEKYAAVVVDGKSHAGAFVNALLEAGVGKRVVVTPTWPEVATGNAMLLDAVVQKQVTHLATEGQRVLGESVEHTTKKIQKGASSGAWSFESTREPGDEVPVAAVALAHWGAKTSTRVPGRKQTVGGMLL